MISWASALCGTERRAYWSGNYSRRSEED